MRTTRGIGKATRQLAAKRAEEQLTPEQVAERDREFKIHMALEMAADAQRDTRQYIERIVQVLRDAAIDIERDLVRAEQSQLEEGLKQSMGSYAQQMSWAANHAAQRAGHVCTYASDLAFTAGLLQGLTRDVIELEKELKS